MKPGRQGNLCVGLRQVGFLQDLFEVPDGRTRLDGRSDQRSKNKAALFPPGACDEPFLKLARTMSTECANKGVWYSQSSPAAVSLGLDELERAGSGTEPLAANSLQRLPNRKLLPFQIEIYPAQPECFAFAKPKPERHAV